MKQPISNKDRRRWSGAALVCVLGLVSALATAGVVVPGLREDQDRASQGDRVLARMKRWQAIDADLETFESEVGSQRLAELEQLLERCLPLVAGELHVHGHLRESAQARGLVLESIAFDVESEGEHEVEVGGLHERHVSLRGHGSLVALATWVDSLRSGGLATVHHFTLRREVGVPQFHFQLELGLHWRQPVRDAEVTR